MFEAFSQGYITSIVFSFAKHALFIKITELLFLPFPFSKYAQSFLAPSCHSASLDMYFGN